MEQWNNGTSGTGMEYWTKLGEYFTFVQKIGRICNLGIIYCEI